jgi:hypothetical protein
MITWFSAFAARAPRAGLVLGAALGVLLAARAVGAEEPAPSAKVRERRQLSEARLGAARGAAAAGQTAAARDLYGQALAAGLAAEAQALAEAGVPRPSSVTSAANEQPVTPLEAAPAAPLLQAEAEAAEARRAAEQAAAEKAARERAETEAREEARRNELRRAEPPTAAPVVVAVAPVVPSAPPPSFQVGLRVAPAAKDTLGDGHLAAGLAVSALALSTAYGRGSVVVDLESTRWEPARDDRMDRAQVAFYGLGFDWTVPFASHGTGVFAGAEAVAGVLQTSSMAAKAVGTDGVLQLMPHLGGAVAYRGVGFFADAGWRFQLLADSGEASVGGLVLQGGLRVEMAPGDARPSGLDLGYTARFFSPNGSRVWSRYGGLFGADAGPLLEHEVAVSTSAFLPPALHLEQGLAFTALGASQEGGGTALTMLSLGWVGTWHAFATRQLFNPYLGVRIGAVYISTDDPSTFQYKQQLSPVISGMAGVDVAVLRRVAVRAGVAYDDVLNANSRPDGSLSGYAVEAGVVVRL